MFLEGHGREGTGAACFPQRNEWLLGHIFVPTDVTDVCMYVWLAALRQGSRIGLQKRRTISSAIELTTAPRGPEESVKRRDLDGQSACPSHRLTLKGEGLRQGLVRQFGCVTWWDFKPCRCTGA